MTSQKKGTQPQKKWKTTLKKKEDDPKQKIKMEDDLKKMEKNGRGP